MLYILEISDFYGKELEIKRLMKEIVII